MPKLIPVEDKRVSLNCLVLPGTRTRLGTLRKALKLSDGKVIDRAVEMLLGIEQGQPTRTLSPISNEARGAVLTPEMIDRATERIMRAASDPKRDNTVHGVPRPFKGPILRPGEKKR